VKLPQCMGITKKKKWNVIYIIHGQQTDIGYNKEQKGNQESYDLSLKNNVTTNHNFFCSGHRGDAEVAAAAAGGGLAEIPIFVSLPPLVSE
jgi:hypothetical protein